MSRLIYAVLSICLCLPVCARSAPVYVDARDYPVKGAGVAAFAEFERRWESGFDDACSDALCGSGYGNYRPVYLRCVVRAVDGSVQSCHWAVAGSAEGIDPKNGRGEYEVRTLICAIPMPSNVPLQVLLATADDEDPFNEPLPRGGRIPYEVMRDCVGAMADGH